MSRRKRRTIALISIFLVWCISFGLYKFRYYTCYAIAKSDCNYFSTGVKVTEFDTYLKHNKSNKYAMTTANFTTDLLFNECNVSARCFEGSCNQDNYYVVLYNGYRILIHSSNYDKSTISTNSRVNLLHFATDLNYTEDKCNYSILGQGYLGKLYTTLIASDQTLSGTNFVSYIMASDPNTNQYACVTVFDDNTVVPATKEEFNEMIKLAYTVSTTVRFDAA